MFYRIKETHNRFIPQKLTLLGWQGIDKESNILWDTEYTQFKWCTFKTLEEAKERVRTHKAKYHKV